MRQNNPRRLYNISAFVHIYRYSTLLKDYRMNNSIIPEVVEPYDLNFLKFNFEL